MEGRPLGKRLAVEIVSTLVFVAIVRTAFGWESSRVRMIALEGRERVAAELEHVIEALRFRNAVQRTLDEIDVIEEVAS